MLLCNGKVQKVKMTIRYIYSVHKGEMFTGLKFQKGEMSKDVKCFYVMVHEGEMTIGYIYSVNKG